MQYIEVTTILRPRAMINLELSQSFFGKPYSPEFYTKKNKAVGPNLWDNTDVAGFEWFVAYAADHFNGPMAQADEALYERRSNRWFGENFRDWIVGSRATQGGLELDYISHEGLSFQKEHKPVAPENGWYVYDTQDATYHKESRILVPFYPGTLIPFETVKDKKTAQKRNAGAFAKRLGIDTAAAKALAQKVTAGFWRLDAYTKDDPQIVGRDFYPDLDDYGRCNVLARCSPSFSGIEGVSSRARYAEPAIVGRIDVPAAPVIPAASNQ